MQQAKGNRQAFTDILNAVEGLINDTTSSGTTLYECSKRIGRHTGYQLARVTAYPETSATGSPPEISCYLADDAVAALGGINGLLSSDPDAGLSSHVTVTGKEILFDHISNVDDLKNAGLFITAGIKSACAFPVLSGNRLAAVIEFYTLDAEQQTSGILSLAGKVCSIVGSIIENKKTGQELLIYKKIVDASSDLMAVIDRNFIYQAVNQFALEGLQKNRAEVIGNSIFDQSVVGYFTSMDRNRLEMALQGETVNFQSWITLPGYGRTYQDIKYIPYRNTAGGITGIVISARDITETKLVEDELRSNEQRLRKAQQIAKLGFWESDVDREEILLSDDIYSIYGINREEFASTKEAYLSLVHPEDRERLIQAIETSIRDNKPYQIEHRIVRPDGKIRYVHVQSDMIRDDREGVIHRFGIIMDITERKTAEAELVESEARLRKAQSIARMGFWEINYLTDTLYISDELYSVFGINPDNFEGTVDALLMNVHAEDRDRVNAARGKFFKEGKPFNIDYRIVRGDEVRHIHVQGEFVLDAEKTPLRLVGTIQDITERKLTELALSRSNRALQVVNECNHAIVYANSGQEMINEICRLIVETGGYRFAWVGYAGEDQYKTVYPVAHAGFEAGYLENTFSWKESSRKFDPVSDAIMNGQACIVKNIADTSEYQYLRVAALERAFRSEIALPLNAGEKAFGALMIYASESDAFDNEEKDLLMGLADELAFGILSMYMNAKHEWAEAMLRENEKKYRLLYDENPAMFFTTNAKGIILSVNKFGAEELGYTVDELIGTSIFDLGNPLSQEEISGILQQWLKKPGQIQRREQQKICRDGRVLWVRETVRVVTDTEDESNIFIVCEDITETRKLSEQLSYQATHDSLTDLINRGEFENRLMKLLRSTQVEDTKHALCYMDLDQFKLINDTCGHMAGDELLRQLGMVLLEHIRKRDTVARLGGDEFGILMEHCPLHRAEYIARKLIRAIADFQFVWAGRIFRISASIGLVPINMFSGNLTELMKNADTACYTAKKQGRNRIHVFGEDDSGFPRDNSEQRWLSRIQEALEADRFRLLFQPIVPLQPGTGTIPGFEVLVRMETKEGDLVLPDTFLPVAEYYNLSHHIDRWVICSLFKLLTEEANANSCDVRYAINLSGHSLGDRDLLELISSQLDKPGIVPANICFEITETVAIGNLTCAMKFINTLRERGCRFSLDDFGSGLSSFAYLRNLAIDYLKIDGSFIRGLADDSINMTIVRSMRDIGKALGKLTVAECVEDEITLGIVRDMGFDYAQGNFLGEARPFERITGNESGNIVEFTRKQ